MFLLLIHCVDKCPGHLRYIFRLILKMTQWGELHLLYCFYVFLYCRSLFSFNYQSNLPSFVNNTYGSTHMH